MILARYMVMVAFYVITIVAVVITFESLFRVLSIFRYQLIK
jgi:hypothetical protein